MTAQRDNAADVLQPRLILMLTSRWKMRRISSRMTFVNKRLFPLVWFGFLAFFVVISIYSMIKKGVFQIVFFITPIVMTVFGYLIMKKLVFDLVDEAWDVGDALIVKNKNEEVRIPLSDIMNISYSYVTNPARVTLVLRHPSRIGPEVTFMPPTSLIPFKKNPIVAELIERVDSLRKDNDAGRIRRAKRHALARALGNSIQGGNAYVQKHQDSLQLRSARDRRRDSCSLASIRQKSERLQQAIEGQRSCIPCGCGRDSNSFQKPSERA